MADFELQGMPVWVYSKDADSKASIAPSRLVAGTVGERVATRDGKFWYQLVDLY